MVDGNRLLYYTISKRLFRYRQGKRAGVLEKSLWSQGRAERARGRAPFIPSSQSLGKSIYRFGSIDKPDSSDQDKRRSSCLRELPLLHLLRAEITLAP
ncbi:hypothetical protein RRG08_040531 [Elysia crispata]|uniref:Uncharacterized protein n=1 Tax=Elysia crispata TaxID=231223 RepID=A0AAE1DAA0_9GAST|nr:hypothetical protein RRG08_040531 [Elysia crispata]